MTQLRPKISDPEQTIIKLNGRSKNSQPFRSVECLTILMETILTELKEPVGKLLSPNTEECCRWLVTSGATRELDGEPVVALPSTINEPVSCDIHVYVLPTSLTAKRKPYFSRLVPFFSTVKP